jgi:homoserine dehydrogenase
VLGDLYRALLGAPGHLPIPDSVPTPQQPLEQLEEV